MLTIGVLVMAEDNRKEDKVGVRDLVASAVLAAISPVSIKLLDELGEQSNAGLNFFFSLFILEKSVALRLLNDVDNSGEEPFILIDLQSSLRAVAVLEGEHLKDS